MKLAKNRLRLVNVREVDTNEGKHLTFLTLANPQTLETNDFFKGREVDISKYPEGQDYDVTISVNGKYTNVVALEPAPASKTS